MSKVKAGQNQMQFMHRKKMDIKLQSNEMLNKIEVKRKWVADKYAHIQAKWVKDMEWDM